MRSRISSKGQVTVPVAVRDRLGLVPGTAVEFVVREGEAVMRKHGGDDPVNRIYGRLKLGRPVDELIEDLRGPTVTSRMRKSRRRARR